MALRYLGLLVILMGLSLVDQKTLLIPDRFHVAGILWWLLPLPLIACTQGRGLTGALSITGARLPLANAPGLQDGLLTDLKWGLINAFGVGLLMLLISLAFDKLTGKESLGGGDIKLLFMTGLYMRPGVTLFNLMLSCFVGLFIALVLKKDKIPFGPSISIAVFLSILFGSEFVAWYTGLIL